MGRPEIEAAKILRASSLGLGFSLLRRLLLQYALRATNEQADATDPEPTSGPPPDSGEPWLAPCMIETLTDRIARQFGDQSLPCSEWSHEAHLRVGLWHLLRYPPAEALIRLRRGIQLYNAACGIANTDRSGYHETITRLYVGLLDALLKQTDRSRPADELADEVIARLGDRDLPLRYYSRERLFSPAARRHWVEPDLSGWVSDEPIEA